MMTESCLYVWVSDLLFFSIHTETKKWIFIPQTPPLSPLKPCGEVKFCVWFKSHIVVLCSSLVLLLLIICTLLLWLEKNRWITRDCDPKELTARSARAQNSLKIKNIFLFLSTKVLHWPIGLCHLVWEEKHRLLTGILTLRGCTICPSKAKNGPKIEEMRGSGPKGPMSRGTQRWISIHPYVLPFMHPSFCMSFLFLPVCSPPGFKPQSRLLRPEI